MAEAARSNDENPYLPVRLPEFGVSVGWAMYRNAMCPNFGVQYAEGAPDGTGAIIEDGRCAIDPVGGYFRCGRCGLGFTLNSNRAIRVPAWHFLSLLIPFTARTCPEARSL